MSERNAEPVITGPEEKWAPQISPDGKWVLYMQWPKPVEGKPVATGKLMRIPLAGGPAETVMDVTGHPGMLAGADPTNSVGGYPSFRCPVARRHLACSPNPARIRSCSPLSILCRDEKRNWSKVAVDPDTAELGSFSRWQPGRDFRCSITKPRDLQIVPLDGRNSAENSRDALDGTGCDCLGGRWQEPVSGQLFFARNRDCTHALDGRTQTAYSSNRAGIFSRWCLPPMADTWRSDPSSRNSNAWTIANFPRK